ncbi:reverse transcriptase [Gossypium australe]|uniref:Reverse transcriptase n=1 Tax=Gossypium australe TaxID=47621 RepID=A0A5B6VBM8_9ROSI|nr:reverse transcriptase [Gossypium australe]
MGLSKKSKRPRYPNELENLVSLRERRVKGLTRAPEVPSCEHCGEKHWRKCWKLSNACFRCGSHRECPRGDNVVPTTTQRSAPSVRGARKGSEVVAHQSDTRASTRAYVEGTRKEGNITDVVVGIFLLVLVYALIDPRLSHFYINVELVKSRSLKLETSKVAMVVSSLLGQLVLVNQVCKRCLLKIQNVSFPIDLLIKPFGYFD